MDAFLEQRRRASAAMGPLQSLQDVAIFADAQLQCPQGLAGRADRLAELMRSGGVVCNEKEAASLLQRAAGRWLALLRRVRAGPVVAVQTVSACHRVRAHELRSGAPRPMLPALVLLRRRRRAG